MESRPMAEPNSLVTFDRPPVIERLNTVGKRKSTPPQKFMGVYFTHVYTACTTTIYVIICNLLNHLLHFSRCLTYSILIFMYPLTYVPYPLHILLCSTALHYLEEERFFQSLLIFFFICHTIREKIEQQRFD